jgi:hypothetical protein
MRDQNKRLKGWILPHNHFEKDISNFFEVVPEEVPEVNYPQSYQATLGGTPRTVHMNEDGVVFVYFNHGSKAFERVKISPAHAHMNQQEAKSHSTSEIGSAADTRDACTNCFIQQPNQGCPYRQPHLINQRQCRLS